MSLIKTKPTHPLCFQTNGYRDSIAQIFSDICEVVFMNASESSRNIANFSYSFTNAISEVILSEPEIDRNRVINIEVERLMGAIQLVIFYGNPVDGLSFETADRKRISLRYPLSK